MTWVGVGEWGHILSVTPVTKGLVGTTIWQNLNYLSGSPQEAWAALKLYSGLTDVAHEQGSQKVVREVDLNEL